jgi:hypothetical protein
VVILTGVADAVEGMNDRWRGGGSAEGCRLRWKGGMTPAKGMAGEAGVAARGRRRSRGRESKSAADGWEASGREARESWGAAPGVEGLRWREDVLELGRRASGGVAGGRRRRAIWGRRFD